MPQTWFALTVSVCMYMCTYTFACIYSKIYNILIDIYYTNQV